MDASPVMPPDVLKQVDPFLKEHPTYVPNEKRRSPGRPPGPPSELAGNVKFTDAAGTARNERVVARSKRLARQLWDAEVLGNLKLAAKLQRRIEAMAQKTKS
jgi:hypothetical protein